MMHLRALALSAAALAVVANTAEAQTMVPSGNLVGSQTWTAAGSPYVVSGDLTVPAGVTLTIEANALVRLGPGDDLAANLDTQRAELRILGTLIVNGSSAAPVRVISGGGGTSDYYGIVVLPTGAITATALQLERAHRGLTVQSTGAVLNDLRLHDCNQGFIGSGGSATLTGGEVLRSGSYGVNLSSSHSLIATGLRVDGGSSRGVHVSGASLDLSDSIVSENSSYGVYMTSGASITNSSLSHNTIYGNNSYGLYFTGNSNNRVTARSNIISDNRTYGIYRSSSPQVTASHNLVWNSGTAYSGVSAGTGALAERPLFVDGAGGDYNLTSNSGARMSAFDGQDMGALPFAGAATVGLLGHLYTNTLLSAAGSPHTVIGDLTVESGVTLTIEAGAEVRFASAADQMGAGDSTSRTELRVQGNLQAVGTSSNRILLTTPSATPGAWQGLRLLGTAANSSLDYLTIRYATYGLRSNAPATNTVQRTDIRDSSSYGLWADGGAISFDQMRIFDGSSRGVQFSNSASGGISNSLIYANSSYGIYATSGASIGNLSVIGNTVTDNNSYGIYMTGNSNNRVTVRNNIVVGNRTYGIYRSSSPQVTASYNLVWDNNTNYSGVSSGAGAITENPLFVDAANEDFRITSNSPARNHGSTGGDMGALSFDGTATAGLMGHLYVDTLLTQAGSPHFVQGDLTIEPGVTLTIEPGSTLEFAASADIMGANASTTLTELRVLGTLVADGTTSRRITFTPRSGAPARGQWYGVHMLASSQASIIDYTTIEYGRYGVRTSAPSGTVVQRSTIREQSSYGIWGDGGATDFSQLIIRDNASRAFHMAGASGTISNCQVFDNSSYGIYATNGAQISNLSLLHNTIADNNSYGIYITGNSNNRVTVRDNIVTGNRTYGIYRSSSPQVTASYNLVWDNNTNYSGVSSGSGALTENPLFVDLNNSDYRITSRSPARGHAQDGSDMGALTYDGALTVGEQGHMYADVTWTAAASPITVLGDITVEQGVTLTIEAGTTVNFATSADSMGANNSTTLTELIVQGRLQVNGTSGSPVLMNAGSTPGAWYGIHLLSTAANTSIRNAQIRYARYGLRSSAPSSASMTQSEISDSSSYGAYIDGGAIVLDGVWVHDGQSRGVHIGGASPSLFNLLVTDNSSYGVYATSGSAINTTTMNHLTVDNNNSYGIYLTGNSNNRVTIRNSSITNNRTYGIYRSSSPQVTLGLNNVWTNGTNYSGVSQGAGSISANPQFVNAALGNYQLLPNSTLIDAADAATALSSDLEGTARPIDGDNNTTALPDLGAFEFNPSNNRWPIADAGPDRVATAGLTISFDGSGSNDPDGTIATYAWDFGDGSTGTGSMVTHTFTGGTDRTVTLTVTDNQGAQDVDTIFVEVNLAPTAEAGPPKFGDPGEIISFVGSGSSDSDGTVVSYAWAFGDGTVGTGVNVSHTYSAPGNYTVTLTITDDDGATGADTTTVNIAGADTTPPTIVHAPVPNGQAAGQPVVVSADITDASGLSSATLMYRAIGASTFTSATMSNTSGATYVGTVPGTSVNAPGVEYYVLALDNAMPANSGSQPGNAPLGYFTFTVSAPAAPVVTHTPIGNGQAQGQAVNVAADVTASAGLSSVVLYYRAQGGGAFSQAPMSSGAGTTYQAQIPSGAVLPPAVEYYVSATDNGTPAQTTTHPPSMGAVHAFTVTASDTSAPSITHVPIAAGQPAGQPVSVSASITDPSGVQTATLYYRVAGGGAFASLNMVGSAGTFSASIPGASVSVAGVEYYIEAQDQATPANTGTHPAGAPTTVHSFTAVRVFNVSAGDIVISEIMADPSGTESAREWIELFNSTAGAIDIDGFTVRDDGVDAFTISNGGPLMIASGAYLILGRNADSAVNGGVSVDYVYSGMALANTDDEVVLSAGALEVDRVAYDAGATFIRTPGRSITLDPDQLDALANDSGGSWCAGSSPMASGDFGSPGTVNDSCQDLVAPVVVHTPIADGQQANLPVSVSAVVTDDSGLSAVEAFYRVRGQGAYASAPMALIGGDVYQAEIPAAVVTTVGVEYYVRAVDAATPGNEALEPAGAPLTVHDFDVTTNDTSGPSINHNPIQDGQDSASSVEIIASVADPSGVQDVVLYYRITGQTWQNVTVADLGQDVYRAEIPVESVTAAGVEYYLEATDTLANASALPAAGQAAPFAFTVIVRDEQAPSILHTPIADGQPEGIAIDVQAEVKDASGLSEVLLYFRASGEVGFLSAAMSGNGDSYSAQLPAALIRGAGLDYYIEAIDGSAEQNTARDPGDAPTTVHSFTIGGGSTEDLEGPSILHLGVSDAQLAGRNVLIVAEVADPSGVAAATVRYRTVGTTDFSELQLIQASGTDRYEGNLPGSAVVTPGVEYYIVATDEAAAMNTAQRPETAPAELLSFTVMAGSEGENPRDEGGCRCVQDSDAKPTALSPFAALLLCAVLLRRRRK